MKQPSERILPGDPGPNERIASMIRVDHAGEYGAKRIYAGQLAVLKHDASAPVIAEMAAQEQAHLEAFDRMIADRGVRPTVLMPVWHVAGWLLGAGTALLGPKAAMACTVAVESVIDKHYAEQESALGDEERELKATVRRFREEEREHHDTGLHYGAEDALAYPVLRAAVERATKLAIWLSKRI